MELGEEQLADELYLRNRGTDPYPEILPALLNSADLVDYIHAVGIISPFNDINLRGVTLSLTVGKLGVYWDEKHNKVSKDIQSDGYFVLKSNTIAYVQIAEKLRLPAYIIARFNLRVTLAYRGILLGTGPIVDPGFNGNLNIPLHNLTSNEYVFAFGEPLIEMEFTKLSPNNEWDKSVPMRTTPYKDWKPSDEIRPNNRGLDYYLNKASLGRPIESSLPPLADSTEEAIEKAVKLGEKVDTSLSRINVGLLFSFGALLGAIIAIVSVFKNDIKEINGKKYEERIRYLSEEHKKDSVLLDSIRRVVADLPR